MQGSPTKVAFIGLKKILCLKGFLFLKLVYKETNLIKNFSCMLMLIRA